MPTLFLTDKEVMIMRKIFGRMKMKEDDERFISCQKIHLKVLNLIFKKKEVEDDAS